MAKVVCLNVLSISPFFLLLLKLSFCLFVGSWTADQILRNYNGQNCGRTCKKKANIFSESLCQIFYEQYFRHDQLKTDEKSMEDQIKVNAEAVESLNRILTK